MDYKKYADKYVIRLDRGDEIVESIRNFCRKEDIKAAKISGIGATNHVVIGIYELENKKYHEKEFKEDFEITSLMGNVSTYKGDLIPHLHINLGDKDFNVKGGHLQSAIISVTGEIFLEPIEDVLEKEINEDTGIKILKF
ncbi:PPC domain-containing DNA-binding protein [Clostridium cochlearium]|uniref:PPC domain-containing DNA-binding protein n=1 Tax=Clostridium cochlearium TaxID=1494 RepID=UPI00156E45DF|nr:PPC domain-containing DNA-binding protein [Clostridium cochlearium]MCG4578932.1 DNA-binding protein [Clostridium cochlearium]NSJ90011.1 DNA-binding protein [Coprococcus sp. MSK.21.13]